MTLDAAWLAGFLDGEGTISLGRKWQRSKFPVAVTRIGLRAEISVGGTDLASLERIEEILRSWGIRCHVSWRVQKSSRWKPFWKLRVDSQERIARLLDHVGPYLVTKGRQAALMRRFIQSRGGLRGKTHEYTEAERAIAAAMRLLNQRGTLVENEPTSESTQAPAGEWPVGSVSERR